MANLKNKNYNKKKYSYYIMGTYFFYFKQEEDEPVIIQLNSFNPTTRKFEYVVEIFPNDDDEPSLNMYKFFNKQIKYNH